MRRKDAPTQEVEVEKKVTKGSGEEGPITQTTEIKMNPHTDIKVSKTWLLGQSNTKVLSVHFEPEDKYLAAACESGHVQIYNLSTGKLSYTIASTNTAQKQPFSCVRWRPKTPHAMTKNVLVTTNADGEIQHWHMTSGKCLNTIKEPSADPQLYCINYNHDVTKFVAVGSEPTIKIYDEETKKLEYKLTGSGSSIPGHNSRVFCGKFDHEDPNIIVTGGWDERVLIWDLREKAPVRRIYGPRICGDGIDVFEGEILTTSWTETDQLQIWDLGSEKLIHKVNWDDGPKTSLEPCKPYAGQFSKNDGSLILAGGSNAYEAKIFDREKLNRHVCTIYGMSREVNSVDFSNKGDKFALGGSDGYIRIFSMNIIA